MKKSIETLKDKSAWERLGIKLPAYDVRAVTERTKREPCWLHFGAGNIFRAFPAAVSQRLLNERVIDRGIIAVETFDAEIIDRIFRPYDNLTMNVTLKSDGDMECEILASVAEAFAAREDMERLEEIFISPSLQFVSFTITEKGYALRAADGKLIPVAETDIKNGLENPRHVISIVAAMLYKRRQAGAHPVALVSMDNCSANGDKLKDAVIEIAEGWALNGHVGAGFTDYLRDGSLVSFPWTMIDKITPRPSETVADMLSQKGVDGMAPIITAKQTYIAPFVNAERPQYLVAEDDFPNGRPPLERARGVIFTDRETVNRTERMKVTACLNPLHTAMAVFGCLLGFDFISEEMRDPDIRRLVTRLGYDEGLPVVDDPKLISPREFLDEVINERFPNPFTLDTPQRIATDTSQKVGIRFGETIKSYIEQNRDLETLTAIPLAIAAWFRYLLGVDDSGSNIELSPDPLQCELSEQLSGIVWNDPSSYDGQLKRLLSDSLIFGLDLTETALAARIEQYFVSMLGGAGSVRETLREALANASA